MKNKISPSVLIVDDESYLLELFKTMLIHLGFNPYTALDGEEGLAKFQKVRFDLILTDILMPRLDGNDMARRIRRSSFAAPPIIAMSGTPWDVQRDMFDGVLCKPFSFQDLNKLIYKIL